MENLINGEEAFKILSEGGVVEFGERYYRYDPIPQVFEYRDYNQGKWKVSNMTIEEFLKHSWNVTTTR